LSQHQLSGQFSLLTCTNASIWSQLVLLSSLRSWGSSAEELEVKIVIKFLRERSERERRSGLMAAGQLVKDMQQAG